MNSEDRERGATAYERHIRGSVLAGFADLVREKGADPEHLIDRAGLPRYALTDFDAFLSWQRVGTLMELAAEKLKMPSFGLEWALRMSPHFPNAGPIMLIASGAETLAEWGSKSLRYWQYRTNAYTLELAMSEGDGDAIFRFNLACPAYPSRQQIEHTMGTICIMARVLTGINDLRPGIVRFQHHIPVDTTTHGTVFKCDIEFGASHNEIVFNCRDLASPITADTGFRDSLVSWYTRSRMRSLPTYDQTIRTNVALVIRSIIGIETCTLEFVAHALNLSSKKLQRLLGHEGTSFSSILDDIRYSMARSILADTEMPVASIAGLLDYSTTAAFTLAFKRWSGFPPSVFRRRGTPDTPPRQ